MFKKNNAPKIETIEDQQRNEWKGALITMMVALLVGFGLIFGMKAAGLSQVQISGESMANTFHDGTYLLIHDKKLEKGNIVVFNPPESWDKVKGKTYIKRVVATAGDKVEVTENAVIVNGKQVRKINKDYLDGAKRRTGSFIVPEGYFFPMGDNYMNSNDGLFEFSLFNDEFLVNNDNIIFTGEKFFSFQYKPTK